MLDTSRGFGCFASGGPPARKAADLIEKETLMFCIGCFWIVGAVFNRDDPFNRGWPATSSVESKPLPPTVNYS